MCASVSLLIFTACIIRNMFCGDYVWRTCAAYAHSVMLPLCLGGIWFKFHFGFVLLFRFYRARARSYIHTRLYLCALLLFAYLRVWCDWFSALQSAPNHHNSNLFDRLLHFISKYDKWDLFSYRFLLTLDSVCLLFSFWWNSFSFLSWFTNVAMTFRERITNELVISS